ncbi:MAG: iron-siderophore ABC transporter substrate-binding protein [Actinomycetota bacterium]
MPVIPHITRRAVAGLALAIALTGAAACGGDSDDAESSPTTASPSESSPSESSPSESSPSVETTSPPSTTITATTAAPTSAPSASTTQAAADDENPSATTATTSAAPVFPRTVEDALGTVEIDIAPQTVVVLDQSLLDAAFALGLDVAGYTTFMDPDGQIDDLYGDARDEYAATAEWVGDLTSPNLERIAQIGPDMILTSAVRHQDIRAELSAIAPTIMSESAGAGWKDTIRLVGDATGREAQAEAALADYEARAAALGEQIAAAAGEPEVSVVRFVDVIRLYNPLSFSGTVLTDVGLARPETQRSTDDFITIISPEQIDQADGDVLIYSVFDNPEVEDGVDQLLSNPLWETLGAVQNGEVYRVADNEWMSGVGLFGAEAILRDLADIFGVDASS